MATQRTQEGSLVWNHVQSEYEDDDLRAVIKEVARGGHPTQVQPLAAQVCLDLRAVAKQLGSIEELLCELVRKADGR